MVQYVRNWVSNGSVWVELGLSNGSVCEELGL